MAQVIVRNLENDLKEALKRRAQRHGCSMEEEVRQILRRAVNEEPETTPHLGSRIAKRFAGIGLETPLPELHGQEIDPAAFDA
jgi:plasmid stability protein